MSRKAPLALKSIGNVNLRLCEGTYLSNISSAISSGFRKSMPKKFILERDDLKIRMRLFVNLRVNEPHFDSQTKVRYVGPSIKNLLDQITNEATALYKRSTEIQNDIEFINNYKILRKANASKNGSSSKVKLSTGNPLRACSSKFGKRLYIVEGPSAGNSLTQARDPKLEAVFPLQGKIINSESQTIDKVLNNKFVKFLLEAVGVRKIGETFNPKFEKYVILADADADGLQIGLLVMLIFYKIIPNIIKENRLIVLSPPLYGAIKGKEFIPLYKVTDLEEYQKKGYRTIRFKGLGEMTSEQMKVVIRKGKTRTVVWSDEAVKLIKDLFVNSKTKRDLLKITDDEIESHLFGIQ